MQTNLKKKTEGFTIIEVLIVLVVAGLIMLIVFLAVPALQRNSRNTQRESDAAKLVAAAKESIAKRNNQLPTSKDDFISEVKLGYYDTANVSFSAITTTTPAANIPVIAALNVTGFNGTASTRPAENGVVVITGAKCNAAGTNLETAFSNRAVAAVFGIETGGAAAYQCIES